MMKHTIRTSHAGPGRVSMILLVLLGLGLLLLGIVLFPIPSARNKDAYPSKKASPAVQFFHQHRADIERLQALVSAHPALVYLHLERREIIPKDIFANDAAAFNEVLVLMTRLQLISLNGLASSWGMRLSFWSQGMVTASTTQSFWFSQVPPDPDQVFTDFGDQLPKKYGSGSSFCEITPQWYLRLDWGG